MLSCAVTLQKEASWKMDLTAVLLLQPLKNKLPTTSVRVYVYSSGLRHNCHKAASLSAFCPLHVLGSTAAGGREFTPVPVCAWVFVWLNKKRKSLLYNREICWEWSALTPGVQAKQSVNAAEAAPLALPTGVKERQNGGRGVPETLTGVARAWWSSFRGDSATCYSLCDTNILHYTLRHWDIWTSLRRPSLTR